MSNPEPKPVELVRRVLAKPLVHRGEPLEPGAEVELRQDQVDNLEPRGYFQSVKGAPKR